MTGWGALFRLWCGGLAAALMLSGCVDTRGGPVAYEPAGFARPDSDTPLHPGTDQVLAPLDTLSVSVFQVQDLSGDYQVDLAGNVTLPLLGSLRAAGMTAPQLAGLLTQRYGQKYLENPKVQVVVKTANPRSITVDGGVEKPGVYPVAGTLTLIQAVALAGGISQDSNPRRVVIFRTIDGKRAAAAFDLSSIRHNQMTDPPVYGNDIVVVDGAGLKGTLRDAMRGLPMLSAFRFL